MTESIASTVRDLNRRLRAGWGVALLAVVVVSVLLCLAAANVVVRGNWSEVEDGVWWAEQPAGLVAVDIYPQGAGAAAGVQPGDELLSVDGRFIETTEDLLEVLHEHRVGDPVTYTVLRRGATVQYDLMLLPSPSSDLPQYFVLVGVGIFALLIGASVRVRLPGNQATLHFFWLTVAFFGMLAFSYSGRLDRLDWVFFWADDISTLLLAPLFLHFALVFPERTPGRFRNWAGRWVVPIIYLPALGLGTWLAFAVGTFAPQPLQQAVEAIWRLEMAYLAACIVGGLAIMIIALRRVHSMTARRQLRWIVSGAVLGGLPFTVGYAIPWSLGFQPFARLDLTAILLCVVPLTFASAIIHYRLHDVEVIVKRGVVYIAAVAAMVTIYVLFEQLASAVFLDQSDQHNTIIALLATAVVVLTARPVLKTIQTMLDRVYYRDRYDYRRALVGFARDLNSDLDLDRLTERLVTRVSETLVVDRMVLLDRLSSDRDDGFVPLRWTGFPTRPPTITPVSELGTRLRARRTVAVDVPVSRGGLPAEEASGWRGCGLHYFVPCVSEEGTIAVMGLGRKGSGEPLSSEDMALLAAVAGQVATALQNGRLYGQLRQKAAELDRMRQFSENIIESLNDGLVVFDLDDCVVRWNAGLERLYGLRRGDAVGQPLDAVFDAPFAARIAGARDTNPAGAVLYRVPLRSRHREAADDAADPGRRLLVNVATAPVVTPDGSTSGMMMIVEDITQRVRLEEQLQISEKMASIGLLAAGVAHEVNTPLTGISSFTQMLLDGADPEDPRTKVLEKIEHQTFRAAKIVNGLLNLARPGRSDAVGPVDLNTVVSDVLALLEHQLAAGSVQVRRELPSTPIVVAGVEFKLQQVFLNLFLNARDAMPKGGRLTVRAALHAADVIVEVADTGSGIAPEVLSRIYDPFFTTKGPGQGTGLGLSVTYGVVQEHHGSIECASTPGQGTRFTLRLPLATPAREQLAEAAS